MPDAAAEFWDFSLALYAKPGVAPACLVLQDEQGRDVNLALYCAWVGWSGRGRLSRDEIAAAERVLAPWRQQVVEPLRAARRSIKGVAGAEPIYTKVKALELEAEREAQRLLAARAPLQREGLTATERAAAAAADLSLYVGVDGANAAAPIVAALHAMAGEKA
jgi:uncharacterized protein (TIGR02444 family)